MEDKFKPMTEQIEVKKPRHNLPKDPGSEKIDWNITGFNRRLRDAVTRYTKSLGMRGNAKYIENLIKKDLDID